MTEHKTPIPYAGLVLAAGAGTRYGRPKALVRDADGQSWLTHAVGALEDAGCHRVIVVLGARGTEAAALLEGNTSVDIVQASDWADGLSASLRAGLSYARTLAGVEAVAVVPVDVPGLNADMITRVLHAGTGTPAGFRTALSQAYFSGRPGHPVLIGRSHWTALAEGASGDTGAGPYLRAQAALHVECGDLGSGRDVDQPPILST